jgi:hypothetical protein
MDGAKLGGNMIYKLIEDEQGEYFGSDGKRYTLLEAVEFIDTPEGRNVGCYEFDNIEQAMGFFEIQKEQNDEPTN